MTPETLAATVAALSAADGDRRKAADSLGITVVALAFRIFVCRKRGLLPRPGPRPPRPVKRTYHQTKRGASPPVAGIPAIVLDAAARVAGGCPEWNDDRIVFAWTGYDDPLDRAGSCVAAAKRILAR